MSGSGTKLFVYGVHNSCPKTLLEDEFGRSGKVEDVYITEKGYAFVTMTELSDAEAAVADLNGKTIDGQEIKVGRIE
jgi:RNA recognition motif-containing protein